MWWLLFPSSLIWLSLSSPSTGPVLNEVYYDHIGADGGWEFVELFNGGPGPVCLAGWSLQSHDGGGGEWGLLWQGTAADTVDAGGVFVIGGEHVTPPPAVVLPLSMQNGPDAIRLVDNGIEADRLGYGQLDDAALFEGSSAPDVPAGSSLGRYPDGTDTQHNADDFAVLVPSPGRLNRPRDNVSLSSLSALRAAAPSSGHDTIEVRLTNDGVNPVAAGAIEVSVTDTAAGPEALDRVTNPDVLAAGESCDVSLHVVVHVGYTALLVSAAMAADERPEDNHLLFLRRLGDLDILLSEVMSDPPAGCPEYVEVFNAGATPRDLAGYKLRDRVSAPSLVADSALVVPPGGYLALTGDAGALARWFSGLAKGTVSEISGAWPSLNHSGSGAADSVVLLDRFAIPVERISYPPQPATGRGRSLERIDLFAGERPHTWLLSQHPAGGTPGAANSRMIARPTTSAAVSVSPNPMDLSRGEPLLITVPARDGVSRSRVQIFDIVGRRVADLGSSQQMPIVYIWDGRDSRGRGVVPGFYIVACEFHSPDWGQRSVERVVVGCARKTE